jgi:hypothetical protein
MVNGFRSLTFKVTQLQKPKRATRGRWVAVLVFTIGDQRALIPVVRELLKLPEHRSHLYDFRTTFAVLSLRSNARHLTLDGAFLSRLQELPAHVA